MSRICFLQYGEERIVDSLAFEFQKLKNEIRIIRIDPEVADFQQIRQQIDDFEPEACLTHNYYVFDHFGPDRLLERYLSFRQIPCIIWFFDSPVASGLTSTSYRFLYEDLPENFLSVTVDSAHRNFLESRSLRSDFLPIAAGDHFFEHSKRGASSDTSFNFDLSYCGKPIPAQNLPPLQSDADLRQFYQGLGTQELLSRTIVKNSSNDTDESRIRFVQSFSNRAFGSFFSRIYTSPKDYEEAKNILLNDVRESFGEVFEKIFLSGFGRIDFLYSWYQLNLYLTHLSEFNLAVFGGDAWSRLLPGYSKPTPRLSDDQMAELFRSSKISFNLTKWHFRNAVHERIPIVYACGGFPITDYREDLLSMYEKDELVMYHSLEEAKDLIRFYLKNETERKKIAEKGRQRTLRDHTYSRRATQLAEIVDRHFGLKLAKSA